MNTNNIFLKFVPRVTILVILAGIIAGGCKKDWLEAKPDIALAVPSTISDFQALLNNPIFYTNDGGLDEIGSGDYYLEDPAYNAVNKEIEKNAYKWAKEIFQPADRSFDWNFAYQRIFYSNLAWEGAQKITPKNSIEEKDRNDVMGSALFYRAYNHFRIATLFCKAYDKNTGSTDLGIPLRLESDVNIPSTRSTVAETYSQIIKDLEQSLALLSVSYPVSDVYRVRPTKASANAMLARVYLAMSEYDKAFIYANQCLPLYSTLMDYNNNPPVDLAGWPPFIPLHQEVLFQSSGINYSINEITTAIVDSSLYSLYSGNDLRKQAFFETLSGYIIFKGFYSGDFVFFTGLATDEIYLIRAECNARKGNTVAAMQDLNTLYTKRWDNTAGPFVPLVAADANDALNKVLIERRKELCFRGIRWSDLKRLNKEPAHAITLKRVINGQVYTLPPNSPLYVLPIPTNVILLSGMQQNPR